jgi:DnaJ-domain-containing protein 1
VSIGKRLIDLARSELNSLLEHAARVGDDDAEDQSRDRGRQHLEDLTDEELEAEIERRRLERELQERARRARANAGAGQARRPAAEPPRSRNGSPPPRSAPRAASNPVARAYAALELPPGSDFETVRKAYRTMMRKYHPDRHAGSPEKQRAATELAQKLTESYKLLEKHLRR